MENTSCAICPLPDDILSVKFKSCEPLARRSDPNSTVFDSLRTDDFPWVLSHVCGRWRALVLDSPLLWSTIQFDMDKFIPTCVVSAVFNDKAAFLLELSLQRSRNVDLRVEIRDVQEIQGVEQERRSFFDSVFPLLFPTTRRWAYLNISGFPDFLEMFSVCSLERLRSLKIVLFKEHRTIFPDVPMLTELRLDCMAQIDLRMGGVRAIELPWSGIRSFTTPIDGLVNLPSMLQLEELHIKYSIYETQNILNHLTSEIHDLPSFVLPRSSFANARASSREAPRSLPTRTQRSQ